MQTIERSLESQERNFNHLQTELRKDKVENEARMKGMEHSLVEIQQLLLSLHKDKGKTQDDAGSNPSVLGMDKGREENMDTHTPPPLTPQPHSQHSQVRQVFNPTLKPHIYHESPTLHTPPHEHHTPPPYTLNPPQPIHQYHQYQFQHPPNHYQINPPPPL